MKSKIIEHLLSIVLVTAGLLVLLGLAQGQRQQTKQKAESQIQELMGLPAADFTDPFYRALLQDVMDIYYPGRHDQNTAAIKSLLRYQEKQFLDNMQKARIADVLSARKIRQILGMYLKFILVYVLVMAFTYYGVQTLAVWRFVRKKQRPFDPGRAASGGARVLIILKRTGITIAKYLAYFVLFSPAYVIAYSIRTEFSTDTLFFLVLLGVISNGLLVTYANKFYAFLKAESRKGYVETAQVKNLHGSYSFSGADGISRTAILRPAKRFPGHVFGHIFQNARYQYLSTLKEQASFLITGLIIIEMALNVHGHLSYELLRQLLYKNYDIVLVIILAIFYTVKMTELFTDWAMHREMLKYENKS